MNSTIILIGPMCAGKTTIAKLLAMKLARPRYSLDELRWDYYQEIGYDEALADKIRQTDGMTGLLRYWKPFEAHAVVSILRDYSNEGVIDFGAGHSVYEDEGQFRQVQSALAPFPHVILLLPSPNPDESVAIVNRRFVALLAEEGIEADGRMLEMNGHFVKHPSNGLLAKRTVYTKNKTPDETCDEIWQWVAK